ncbi:MAG: sigma 54-interacting transcriptional regulator [Deltaproteobacteria bacterium]|nr:sigma 54-interacting transcriptional regulator [Deltaproteobacteria bacterium]
MSASAIDEVSCFTYAEGSAMRRVLEIADRIAPSDAGVLLLGEPGTGREALARRIHALSGRGGRFVVVPCGSLDSTRAPGELFGTGGGHDEEGAGGLHGAARDGTLFLEDLAQLPAPAQAVLAVHLRRGSGGRRPVRVVASGPLHVGADLREGRLRRDLYDSLACSIELPPLRSRPDDVVAIFQRLWAGRGRAPDVAQDALQLIRDHDWPGNVRELTSFATRLALMTGAGEPCRAEVAAQLTREGEAGGGLAVLPVEADPVLRAAAVAGQARRELPPGLALPAMMERLEYAVIDWALEVSAGNRKVAGDLIGLQRTTLVEKLRRRQKAAPAGGSAPKGAGSPRSLRPTGTASRAG